MTVGSSIEHADPIKIGSIRLQQIFRGPPSIRHKEKELYRAKYPGELLYLYGRKSHLYTEEIISASSLSG
jgi:hypothetical protein